jgi:hypothetical protein
MSAAIRSFGKYASASFRLRVQIPPPTVHDRLDAVAVPLDLEQPVRVANAREISVASIGSIRAASAPSPPRRGRSRPRGGRLAHPERVAFGLHLVVGAAGLHALRVVLRIPAGDGVLVALVDEQPLLALVVLEGPRGALPGRRLVRTIVKRPLSFWPWRRNFSSPVRDGACRVQRLRLGLPGAPVPDDDVAGAVLLRRDDALEVEVLDRVVLDVDGHAAGQPGPASGPSGRPS